jgi:arginine repressor
MHQILGSIAGDDTILVIVRDEEAASEIAYRIHELLKDV